MRHHINKKEQDFGLKAVNLAESQIEMLIEKSQQIFISQPNLIELDPPLIVAGDIHGKYIDLLRIFEIGGFPPESNYLFLGDYVDRGQQNLEVICLMLAYKIKYPENFFLLRGNHECASINRIYGFYDECTPRAARPPSGDAPGALTLVRAMRRQAPLLDQAVEDLHRLLQLLTRLGRRRREDHLHARRALARPAASRPDLAHHAPDRRARPGAALRPALVRPG